MAYTIGKNDSHNLIIEGNFDVAQIANIVGGHIGTPANLTYQRRGPKKAIVSAGKRSAEILDGRYGRHKVTLKGTESNHLNDYLTKGAGKAALEVVDEYNNRGGKMQAAVLWGRENLSIETVDLPDLISKIAETSNPEIAIHLWN
jgi:hypothetical protein